VLEDLDTGVDAGIRAASDEVPERDVDDADVAHLPLVRELGRRDNEEVHLGLLPATSASCSLREELRGERRGEGAGGRCDRI
jgi:hypothetical protein